MKKFIIFLLMISFLTVATSCYSDPENDTMVYITATGQKYHRENCRYVRGKAIEISLSKAQREGYDPCKVCKP